MPQGRIDGAVSIPVARVADMLLHPGEPYDFDGERRTYPHARLVHWTGGNPFHHHQDLNRLRRALGRPDTVLVQEPYWTAMARHADIVLPVTTTLERDDIAGGRNGHVRDRHASSRRPVGEARATTPSSPRSPTGSGRARRSRRARRAGRGSRTFTTGRRAMRRAGREAPSFDEFWERGSVELPGRVDDQVLFASFRADPEGHPLRTPTGRIELHSETVAAFGYDDAPGHAAWLEPAGMARGSDASSGSRCIFANNPARRLHSQHDHGSLSQAGKVRAASRSGCNPCRCRRARDRRTATVVRVFNDRGACLAGAVLDEACSPASPSCPPAHGSTPPRRDSRTVWKSMAIRMC